jgi:hypothetical protein
MKPNRMLAAALFVLVMLPSLYAQAKQDSENTAASQPDTSLEVQAVVTEFDGPKEISRLPYTIPLILSLPSLPNHQREYGSLRIGVKVPISIGTQGAGPNGSIAGGSQDAITYTDVGTDIDCWAQPWAGGKYYVEFSLERTSLYSAGREQGKLEGQDWVPGDPVPGGRPLIHNLRDKTEMILRDGQTAQALVATDPLTGHVYKIEVTLTVLK